MGVARQGAGGLHRLGLLLAWASVSLVPGGAEATVSEPLTRHPTPCLMASPRPAGALRGLSFADAADGWAVGDGAIIATRDGGDHWSVQFQGPARLSLVDAVDVTHVWALGDGVLFHTVDGGSCWRSQPEPRSPLVSIQFIDGHRGWGIAVPSGTSASDAGGRAPFSGGSVVASEDGGQSWHRVPAPPDAESVWFASPRLGWVGAGGSVYRTQDGGRHWTVVLTPPPPQLELPYLPTVRGSGGGEEAWALFTVGQGAASQSPYLGYHTVDGGRHWACVLQGPWEEACPGAPRSGDFPGPFDSIGDRGAVFSGYSPARTSPSSEMLDVTGCATGSETCSTSLNEVGATQEILGISFVSRLRGWIVGKLDPGATSKTAILMTRDGGAHWTIQKAVPDT